jgi:hypothetical protein
MVSDASCTRCDSHHEMFDMDAIGEPVHIATRCPTLGVAAQRWNVRAAGDGEDHEQDQRHRYLPVAAAVPPCCCSRPSQSTCYLDEPIRPNG